MAEGQDHLKPEMKESEGKKVHSGSATLTCHVIKLINVGPQLTLKSDFLSLHMLDNFYFSETQTKI